MTRNIMIFFVPITINVFATLLVDVINLAYIGNLNDATKIAAIGVGNMLFYATAFAFIFGIHNALSSLIAAAYS
jgi:Na+-driven multidrug efflux pump